MPLFSSLLFSMLQGKYHLTALYQTVLSAHVNSTSRCDLLRPKHLKRSQPASASERASANNKEQQLNNGNQCSLLDGARQCPQSFAATITISISNKWNNNPDKGPHLSLTRCRNYLCNCGCCKLLLNSSSWRGLKRSTTNWLCCRCSCRSNMTNHVGRFKVGWWSIVGDGWTEWKPDEYLKRNCTTLRTEMQWNLLSIFFFYNLKQFSAFKDIFAPVICNIVFMSRNY